MEIERKYLIEKYTFDPDQYDSEEISQAYLSTDPVIRVRERCRHTDSGDQLSYELTVKGRGLMAREEINLVIDQDAYTRLAAKAEGHAVEKTRYRIPLSGSLICELDVFKGGLNGLILGEVEFDSEEAAELFTPPDWFGAEVTFDPSYQNCNLIMKGELS